MRIHFLFSPQKKNQCEKFQFGGFCDACIVEYVQSTIHAYSKHVSHGLYICTYAVRRINNPLIGSETSTYVWYFQLFTRHLSKRSCGQAHVMSVMDKLAWHALRSEDDREFNPNSGT